VALSPLLAVQDGLRKPAVSSTGGDLGLCVGGTNAAAAAARARVDDGTERTVVEYSCLTLQGAGAEIKPGCGGGRGRADWMEAAAAKAAVEDRVAWMWESAMRDCTRSRGM